MDVGVICGNSLSRFYLNMFRLVGMLEISLVSIVIRYRLMKLGSLVGDFIGSSM